MTTRFIGSIGAAVAVGAVVLLGAPAFGAGERIEVGILSCTVSGGSNFLVGSTKRLACRFAPSGGGLVEHYRGDITRIGLDLGRTRATEIRWTVFAPKTGLRAGALAGKYAGVSDEASAGAGIGANALVGGLERSIALNPLSVQTQEGVNIAAGIAGLKLTRR
jgi:hypothetical protein